MQNQHNAIYREEEREMMPMLKHYGVGTVPWGPIAAGRKSPTSAAAILTSSLMPPV
jgi:aryl-alcohol dehydrogenase-like predicted oxidoreductase